MKGRKDLDRGRLRWPAILIIAVLAICITYVSAETYTAGDSNANGQYQIVLIINPDGSQTLSYAGVVAGDIEDHGSGSASPSNTVSQIDGTEYEQSQDLDMSGSYGYALLTGVDANGNKAAVETGFTNADFVHVNQEITVSGDESGTIRAYESGIPDSPSVHAFQHVWSPSFDSIYANSYASSSSGSTSIVSAGASGGNNEPPESGIYGYGGWCSPMFKANQWSTARDEKSYSGEEGEIKNVDSAYVAAGATSPAGYSSGIYGWANSGTLEFDYVGAKAWTNSWKSATETEADIDTKSLQGGVQSIATSPNGNSASVVSNWTWDFGCRPNWVYTDAEASTTEKSYKNEIEVEENIYRNYFYTGSTTAQNSLESPRSIDWGYGTDIHAKHVGGGAGIETYTSSGNVHDWRYVYPHPHPV